jgi:hypothetical protein
MIVRADPESQSMHISARRMIHSLALAMLPLPTIAYGVDPADDTIDIQTHVRDAVYQNQQVIQVIVTNEHQLERALELAQGVWSERVGIGPIDLQVDRGTLDDFRALGLHPVVLIDDLQQHADRDWSRIVRADRLALDQQINNNRGISAHDESWFTNFKQYSEIHSYVDNIAATRPDLASVEQIGTSIEGRAINAITISAPDAPGNAVADRPAIVFNGCQHAREWISPMTVTYLASRFVDEYDTNTDVQQILNNSRIIIVPVVNPDGYVFSWSDSRFWRKNRRVNAGSTEFGVDLNRNWGFEWGNEGSSPSPGSDIYRGPEPFSEPETSAMVALADELGDDLVAHIDFHSFSQLVLWPFGYERDVVTPEPDRTIFDTLARDMTSTILDAGGVPYTAMQSVDLYPAAGTCSDWFYGDRDATSFTVELRPASSNPGFDLPPEEILPTAHENWPAAILFAQRTTQALIITGEQPTLIPAGEPYPVSITITEGVGELDLSSPMLSVQILPSDQITDYPMAHAGNGVFIADLPAAQCDRTIRFSFEAQTSDGETIVYPSDERFEAFAEGIFVEQEDTMESDTGWIVGAPDDSASTGVWERADPQGTNAQPEDDATADGTMCWITQAEAGSSAGSFDIDGGATTLTSPQFYATHQDVGVEVSYRRWYSNDTGASPNADSMQVLISSDDGNTWTLLEEVTENTNEWTEVRFVLYGITDLTEEMRLRFVASDLGEGSIVEAGVDDFRVILTGCGQSAADINGDGILDVFDIFAYLDLFNAGDLSADFTSDGSLDVFDVFAFLEVFNAG